MPMDKLHPTRKTSGQAAQVTSPIVPVRDLLLENKISSVPTFLKL